MIALHVVSEAEARRELDAAIAVNALLDPLAGLQYAVEQLASVRHKSPDLSAINRVGRRRQEARNQKPRIPRAAVGSTARIGADADRTVEQRRISRLVLVEQEVAGLQILVELRLNPVKPHAVIERQ